MRRVIMGSCSSAVCVSLCVIVTAQQPGNLPPAHPPVSVPSNEQSTPTLPANPDDVDTLDHIIDAYYDALSADPDEPRDWERLQSLFMPDGRMIAARSLPDGGVSVRPMSIDVFIDANRNYFERGGYRETEISRKVDTFGNIAQVWSTYEARRHSADPDPYLRGIYSIHLMKGGTRWWIVNMYWDNERPDTPIPDEYLGQDGEDSQ